MYANHIVNNTQAVDDAYNFVSGCPYSVAFVIIAHKVSFYKCNLRIYCTQYTVI